MQFKLNALEIFHWCPVGCIFKIALYCIFLLYCVALHLVVLRCTLQSWDGQMVSLWRWMRAIAEGKQENKTDLSRKRPPDFLSPNICGFPQVHINWCDQNTLSNKIPYLHSECAAFEIVKKLSHMFGRMRAFKFLIKYFKIEEQKAEWIYKTSALADFPRRLLPCSDEQKIFQIFARSPEFPPSRDRCV